MMTPARTDPFEDFAHLRRQLYRLIDTASVGTGGERESREWTPAADVAVTDREVIIALEVPGMTREQISVAVEGQTLAVTGSRERPSKGDTERTLHSEWAVGSFSRSFALGWDVDAESVKAALRDGVLEIRIGRTQEG